MKINIEIRKYVIKRIIKRIEKNLCELEPYGYINPLEYLEQIEYWESKLNVL
jgi:hypothetical protein